MNVLDQAYAAGVQAAFEKTSGKFMTVMKKLKSVPRITKRVGGVYEPELFKWYDQIRK